MLRASDHRMLNCNCTALLLHNYPLTDEIHETFSYNMAMCHHRFPTARALERCQRNTRRTAVPRRKVSAQLINCSAAVEPIRPVAHRCQKLPTDSAHVTYNTVFHWLFVIITRFIEPIEWDSQTAYQRVCTTDALQFIIETRTIAGILEWNNGWHVALAILSNMSFRTWQRNG